MKNMLYLLLLSIFVLGCRKGKKMPDTLYVHYEGPALAGVYPQGAFSHFNPNDIFETDQYPRYVNTSNSGDLATDFNDDLKKLLLNNNIVLIDGPADYSLKVTSMGVSETLYRKSYTDSCSSFYTSAYVYYSKLNARAYVTLSKNGVELVSWEKNANSAERVRDKTDSCNKPKILSAREPDSLFDQLAKEIRVIVSKKLYEQEVN